MRKSKLLVPMMGLVGLTLVGAPDASATVTSTVDAGLLTITGGHESGWIEVECVDGNVSVNGADPDTGATLCDEITSVIVSAGRGKDTVDLSGMRGDPDAFPALTSASIDAGRGKDVVTGTRAVADAILGGPGDDFLHADLRHGDILDGGDGMDTLFAHVSSDVVIADSAFTVEDDTVPFSSIEHVWLAGDQHDQTFDAREYSGYFEGWGSAGNDHLLGGIGWNDLLGDNGDDVVIGGPGTDIMRGGSGNDILRGMTGDDVLWALRGNDILRGGPGDDDLDGGPGRDTCNGGRGDDRIFACE